MSVGLLPATGSRHVVGIGELKVSDVSGDVIVTHALGSCIAVCIWDPVTQVAGLLHFLLPDSRINPERAAQQPGAFADTGIPALFRLAYTRGLDKKRAVVRLIGGAETAGDSAAFLNVGKRNAVAAKNVLWRNGVMTRGEMVGGVVPRTVTLSVSDGRVQVTSAGGSQAEL